MRDELLTAAEAAARLGIKRESIYAYVSRGVLERVREGRASFFRAADVERLLRDGRRPSLHEFGKTSRLSTLTDGELHYRGTPAAELSDRSFESVAQFLWSGRWSEDDRWQANPELVTTARAVTAKLADAAIASDLFQVVLATVTAADPFRAGFSTRSAAHTAGSLLQTLVEAMPQRSATADGSMAGVLWSRLSTLDPTPKHLQLLNAALVMLADHGLSASTYAAQIAASARADLYGVLAVGLGVGSGAIVGTSATAIESMLASFVNADDQKFALSARLRDEERLPGFGHPMHPNGDSRATVLLELLAPFASRNVKLQRAFEVVSLLRQRRLPAPNAYLALGMISNSFEMEPGSSEVIFVVARSAGWIAHAIDEYETGTIRRMRAGADERTKLISQTTGSFTNP